MNRFFFSHIINIGLVIILLALVIIPAFGGELLVISPPKQDLGAVAGLQLEAAQIEVSPNQTDFDRYASFNLQYGEEGKISDNLYLTSFPGQVAIYNRLYRITNLGSKTVRLRVRLIDPPKAGPFTLAAFVLHPEGSPYFSSLLDDKKEGDTLLEVDNKEIFKGAASVLIGEEMVDLLTQVNGNLITAPLRNRHPAKERIYPEPISSTGAKVSSWSTKTVVLAPQEKAYLTAVIRGQDTYQALNTSSQSFLIKLKFELSS